MSDTVEEGDDETRAIAPLFSRYRDGFDDFDAEALAGCFAYPAVIWQLGRGTVFAEADDIVDNAEALLAVLEREGVVSTGFEVVDVSLEERSGFALLDWWQEREDGEVALAYRCHYTLVRRPGEDWRIALLVNEEGA